MGEGIDDIMYMCGNECLDRIYIEMGRLMHILLKHLVFFHCGIFWCVEDDLLAFCLVGSSSNHALSLFVTNYAFALFLNLSLPPNLDV